MRAPSVPRHGLMLALLSGSLALPLTACGGPAPGAARPGAAPTATERPPALAEPARRLAALATELAFATAGEDQEPLATVADFYARHGDRAALADVVAELERSATTAWSTANLAVLYAQAGDRPRFAALRERTIEMLPRERPVRRADVLAILAAGHEWLGDEAAADELAPLRGNEMSIDRMTRFAIAASTRRYARARAIVDELRPSDLELALELLEDLVEAALARGDTREAEAALATSLDWLVEDDAPRLGRYAAYALRLGDEDRARRLAARSIAAESDAPPYLEPWHLQLAEVLRAVGDPAQRALAEEIWASYESSLYQGTDVLAFAILARSRATHGYRAEAEAWLARAEAKIEADDWESADRAWTRENIVATYLLLDDLPAALEHIAANTSPDHRVRSLLAAADWSQTRPAGEAAAIAAAIDRFERRARGAPGAATGNSRAPAELR